MKDFECIAWPFYFFFLEVLSLNVSQTLFYRLMIHKAMTVDSRKFLNRQNVWTFSYMNCSVCSSLAWFVLIAFWQLAVSMLGWRIVQEVLFVSGKSTGAQWHSLVELSLAEGPAETSVAWAFLGSCYSVPVPW